MKFIVIGLGNFGSSLALRLREGGNEVIGIDNDESHIKMHQDKLTHVFKMDSTNELAIGELPLSDTDAVIIAIGDDSNSNASIITAALLKKHTTECRIVARATSDIQKAIFEAMGISETVNPEAEFANQFANRLTITGNLQSFFFDKDYEIAEFEVPESFVGKTVEELQLIETWGVSLITIIHHTDRKNIIGREIRESNIAGIVGGSTKIKSNDTLILFGTVKKLEKMMEEV
jgi:trk system potassium uptake protein TrkA